jgi:tetratricopeptide (TPR) repeat protein
MSAGDDELAGAWQAYHGGDLVAAEAACQRRLASNGQDVAALFLGSLIDYQRGSPRKAIDRLSKLVQLRPKYAEAHNNLGNAFAADGQLAKAEKAFRQSLSCKPNYAEALNNLGNALRDQRKLDEAISSYRHALDLRPDYSDCHNNLGIALARKKKYDEAIASYRRALALNPTFAEPQNNLGIVLAALGRRDEAIQAFRRAIDLRPKYVDALTNLALSLVEAGEFDEAVVVYQRAVKLAPRVARLHNGLATALAKRGGLEDAVEAFRRAIEVDADYAEAHNNLGNALRDLGQYDEAQEHLGRALTLKSDYPEAHNNLGVLMVKRRRLDDAIASYDRAVKLRSNYAEAHLNRALAWLATGDFRRGWVEYEWRWRCPGFRELSTSQPRWDGGLLDGKTILLWTEQGLGDTFQFVRYARLIGQRGGRVWLRAPRSLHPILSRTPGIDRILGEEDQLPRFDCHAPLLSLPRLLGTTLDDIPGGEPYLFPDERLVAEWGSKLSDAAFKLGIAWAGNPRFAADRQRSIPLKQLLPLAGVPGVRIVSLQKGQGTEQLGELADGSSITAFDDQLDEAAGAFMDTAAIVANLDLVVTADTSVAHLAGGMGVPVWVLLPYAADWRWLIEGDTSPWYSTMRLFRQPSPGDWQELVARVVGELREVVDRHVPGRAIQRSLSVAKGWVDRGVQLAERGEVNDAVAAFRRALRYQPDSAEARSNLGNALRTQGNLEEAVTQLERAIALAPDYPEAHQNLGVVFARQRRHDEAIAQFRRAIELKPDFTVAWTSLGLSQAELRRCAEAEASFRRALEIEPRSPRILNNLGNVLSDQGRRPEAVVVLRRAIEVDPRCVDAHNNLGNALRELGERDEAIASFERALAIRPEFPEAHNNLGITWAAKGDYQRASNCYREALRIWPEYPAAHNNLGIALGHQKKTDEAIASYRRALELKPDYAEAHNNLGIALSQEGDYAEAVQRFHRAIELKPDYAEAFSNLGITLTELGRLDEALASYNEALRLKPDYPDAYMNRSLAFLIRGDFERGWKEYETRWQCKDFNARNFKKPQWNGDALEGRRVLLHAEQGFGDTFQFVRYARLVKEERGGTVIVWCPKRLVPLVSQCPYVDQVTIEGAKLPEFDCHLPLLSLPHIFGTTLETIPSQVPYLFAKHELVEQWRDELSYISALTIGIGWQSNPRYRGDRHRSIPLEKFLPLAKVPGVRLISLQKGLGTEQIDKVSKKFSVTTLSAHRDETAGAFMDTAAILKNLDLVVSSDTSLVHLAGGLGVPTWVALPWAADWRWLLKREDSPWYPTMRVFRQQELGNWDELFDRMAGEVWELVKQRRRQRPVPLSAGRENEELNRLLADLKATNEKQQQFEREAQMCEAADDSSPRLFELLKSLRRLDQQRATIKQAIEETEDRELEAAFDASLSQILRERDQQAENSSQDGDRPRDASKVSAPPANGRPAGDAVDPFAVFDRIYRNGGWRGKGSGPGSAPEASKDYIALVNRLINQTPGIRSILDIGCGDWQIMRHVDLSRKRYLGVDVAASVIAANVQAFGRENIRFQVLNPCLDDIPDVDLIMMKDVAQHLPTGCVRKILERIAARCRYALITNDFTEQNVAREIPIGGWRPINVLAPPFDLPGVTLAVWNRKHVTLSTFGR